MADDFYNGELTYSQFLDAIPAAAQNDEEITDLLDAITHEPKVGGFLRVSRNEGEKIARQFVCR